MASSTQIPPDRAVWLQAAAAAVLIGVTMTAIDVSVAMLAGGLTGGIAGDPISSRFFIQSAVSGVVTFSAAVFAVSVLLIALQRDSGTSFLGLLAGLGAQAVVLDTLITGTASFEFHGLPYPVWLTMHAVALLLSIAAAVVTASALRGMSTRALV